MAKADRTAKKAGGKKPEAGKNPANASDSAVLVIFLAILLLIIFFFGSPLAKENAVKEEQEKLLNLLITPDEGQDSAAIVVGNTIDNEKVSQLASKDYSEIKGLAGITSEFVIYFEDEQGNVINIADKPCIGSSYAQINGVNCNR